MILACTGTDSRWPEYPDWQRTARCPAGADGMEVVTFRSWLDAIDDVAAHFRSTGISFPVVHLEKSIGAGLSAEDPSEALALFDLNLGLAQQVGASITVLHLWELPIGDSLLERNLAALPALLDAATRSELVLTVETIPARVGSPLENVRRACELDERCRVTLDTEFLALHDELEAALEADWLWERDLVEHVHVKDFAGSLLDEAGVRCYRIPGEGRIDFVTFFAGLRARGYGGHITLEAPGVGADGTIGIERRAEGLRRLRALTG